MYLDVFDRNPYGTNCWLLAAEGSDTAVVVDPGFEAPALQQILREAGKHLEAVLLTHAHGDHAEAAGTFAGDAPVYVHPDDAIAYSDPDAWDPGFPNPLTTPRDLRTFTDRDVLRLAGVTLEVLHTPGHTPGSSCFRIDGDALVFSGDLVFAGAIGRSDFPNSDPDAMRESLRRFLSLDDDLSVLPGHGPRTTVGRERSTNPFLMGGV
jgi:hydroxyacylglutathione hydrolase